MALRFISYVFLITAMAACSNAESEQGLPNEEVGSSNTSNSTGGAELTGKVGDYTQINGVNLKNEHPRIAITKSKLQHALERAYGDKAVSPYSDWFANLQTIHDKQQRIDLVSLAFLYLATKEEKYLTSFFEKRPTTGNPNHIELSAIDMLYEYMPDSVFLNLMERIEDKGDNAFSYRGTMESMGLYKRDWGYHSAYQKKNALAYSLLMADHPLELKKDPSVPSFDARNFLTIAQEQLEPGGYFYEIERRFAGSQTYNSALAGSPGGFYDNLAYDRAEESDSVVLYSFWSNATGSEAYKSALHDKYRAELYMNLGLPFTETVSTSDAYCKRPGTITGELPRVFDTGTTPQYDLNQSIKALSASIYRDPYTQWFVENGTWLPNCNSAGLIVSYLLHYDPSIETVKRDELPTAKYFNGPGVSVMRGSWDQDSAFGMFLAGEGVGRRYQDANSFIIHRNDFTIGHAGTRTRSNEINEKHRYFNRSSVSKNILKIFDPNETLDVNPDGTKAEAYSGEPMVSSDNLGGQITTEYLSEVDNCFVTCISRIRRGSSGYQFGAVERADITKFEHVEGEYTYTVGDASASYSAKVDYFDREFLFIAPDVFIIFDRVKVSNPSFRKVWSMHTVAEPVLTSDKPVSAVWGKTTVNNAKTAVITQNDNITYLDTLYPLFNQVTVIGGDTEFVRELSPSDIKSTTLDIPRWLEIYVNGEDLTGSVTIYGATSESDKDTEVIQFDGAKKIFFSSSTVEEYSNQLVVEGANWKPNQWKGYKVQSGELEGVITENSSDTLIGNWTGKKGYKLDIYKTVGNTSKYWKRVDAVTTSDMIVDNITLSVPHYFDTEDILGRLHTFAPHTDGKAFNYSWTPNIGQYSVEVEAIEQNELQNFVNVISLKDPGEVKPITSLVESKHTFHVYLDNRLLVFGRDRENIDVVSIEPAKATNNILLFNLVPNTRYYMNSDSSDPTKQTISRTNDGGMPLMSSDMGVINVKLNSIN